MSSSYRIEEMANDKLNSSVNGFHRVRRRSPRLSMKAVIICDWSFRFCRTNSLHNTRHQGQNYELLKNYLYFKAHC